MSDWQPIETAPKDGTWIAGMTTHHKVVPARWSERHQCFELCWVKLKLKKWQPLPEPEARPQIALHGSSEAS